MGCCQIVRVTEKRGERERNNFNFACAGERERDNQMRSGLQHRMDVTTLALFLRPIFTVT